MQCSVSDIERKTTIYYNNQWKRSIPNPKTDPNTKSRGWVMARVMKRIHTYSPTFTLNMSSSTSLSTSHIVMHTRMFVFWQWCDGQMPRLLKVCIRSLCSNGNRRHGEGSSKMLRCCPILWITQLIFNYQIDRINGRHHVRNMRSTASIAIELYT
jgi:hypothetical protein